LINEIKDSLVDKIKSKRENGRKREEMMINLKKNGSEKDKNKIKRPRCGYDWHEKLKECPALNGERRIRKTRGHFKSKRLDKIRCLYCPQKKSDK